MNSEKGHHIFRVALGDQVTIKITFPYEPCPNTFNSSNWEGSAFSKPSLTWWLMSISFTIPSSCKGKNKKTKSPNQSCYPKETYCLLKSCLLWCSNHVANFENRNKCLSKYSTCLLPDGEGNCQDIQAWCFCLLSLKIWLDKDRLYKLKSKIHCRDWCAHQRPC